jgi:hypothetical protein
MPAPPTRLEGPGPWGDPARHLPLDALERGLAALDPPRDRGSLELIVARREGGVRDTPERVRLSVAGGVPGDAWQRDMPDRAEAQIAIMRADVARLLANGQPLSLPGDNLLVEIDLSEENLPAGSRLRVGRAVLEVTPEPHTGCRQFRQRFGGDALRLTADRRHRPLRLRGIYGRVVEPGEVAVGDAVEVLSRASREAAS